MSNADWVDCANTSSHCSNYPVKIRQKCVSYPFPQVDVPFGRCGGDAGMMPAQAPSRGENAKLPMKQWGDPAWMMAEMLITE
jgi:hypothetical protein